MRHVIQMVFRSVPPVLACMLLVSCSEDGNAPGTTLALKPCRVANVENEVKCATLEVFEDRATRQGRRVGMNIVVLPAAARIKEADPVFFFAGGPGQAATDLAREALTILGGLNAKRDIVLIDQRGTGKSNGLACKFADAYDPALVDSAKREQLGRSSLLACRDKLAKHANLALYTTTIAMADIDEIRAALGYEKINLWGGSYGTRAAMEYLRRYPAQVRSVVIDGVAPPSLALPGNFSRDAGAVYDKMIEACSAGTDCAKRVPQLKLQVDELLANLARYPHRITARDALTGVPREIGVTKEGILMAIFVSLYSPEMVAMLPESLSRAKQGDYAPLMALTFSLGEFVDDKIFTGMRFSVMCAEDVPRLDDGGQPPDSALFGKMFVSEFAKACRDWPKGEVPKDFSQPVLSPTPVLILSGGLDPVTPPAFGEEVKKSFPNSVHLVAKNIGHGVSVRGCAPRLIKKFVEAASVAEIDGKCLERLPRPVFFEPMRGRESAEKSAQKPAAEGAGR